MKVKVIYSFSDKNDFSKKYEKDSIVEFPDDRANELIAKGIAKAVESNKSDSTDEDNASEHLDVKKPRKGGK